MKPSCCEQFCSSSRQMLVKLRSLQQVNDEALLTSNAEIGQKCLNMEVS